MCLIVFSYKDHATYPLIFAGNRDEFHARPATPAHFWEKRPDLLAGRDLKAGGTWLGVTTGGRFATVTNYHESVQSVSGNRHSRGDLVTEYLRKATPTESYLSDLEPRAGAFNGFNLIFGSAEALYYLSNRSTADIYPGPADIRMPGTRESEASSTGGGPSALSSRAIEPGLHGLSNEQLDTPWPKVVRAKQLFRNVVDDDGEPDLDGLLDLLADSRPAPDDRLPRKRSNPELERALSAIFIPGDVYGTRASTVVLFRSDGRVRFAERTFGPGGVESGTQMFEFDVEKAAQK